MAPSRRQSNGRSPLVNQKYQITSFFSGGKSTISPLSVSSVHQEENPIPNLNPNPPKENPKKPLLVIGRNSKKNIYSEEVVGKRIRVFRSESWSDGYIRSFEENSGKHLVQYDDAEEEVLDLGKEQIEWVEEGVRIFRRLRRVRRSACEDEQEDLDGGKCEGGKGFGENVKKEKVDDDREDLELEKEESELAVRSSVSRKRKHY